jgi:DNA-binding NtrC family response regulator
MQGKLLRVLDDRMIRPVGSAREIPVDTRIVAATNRDLAQEARQGRFRQDLFYRLDVVSITIPPLRERRGDVRALTLSFVAQLSARLGVPPVEVDDALLARLAAYDWPGNVRELRNLVERGLILGAFPEEGLPEAAEVEEAAAATDDALSEVEKRHILEVLAACGGNKSEAARRLGVSRKTIERKCAEWGV